MAIPNKIEYAIIGAGIHGLSTAWHLAKKLKKKGKGDGSKIIVIEKDNTIWELGGTCEGGARKEYFKSAT